MLLLVADRLDSIRTQLRLSMLVLFLVLFALTTVSFVLQSSLDIAALTVVCLTMLSAGMQLVLVLAWVAPFAILDEKWSPFAALALGYACHFASKSLSTVSMLMGQQSPAVPTSLITGLVLGVACALCVAFVLHLPESGPVGLPAQPSAPSVDAGRVKTPFKDVIAAVGARYGLTAQEERVLFFCAKGKNARAIADEMTVSLNTVKSHLRTLYAKLDVHSQQELIALVDAEVRGERVVR